MLDNTKAPPLSANAQKIYQTLLSTNPSNIKFAQARRKHSKETTSCIDSNCKTTLVYHYGTRVFDKKRFDSVFKAHLCIDLISLWNGILDKEDLALFHTVLATDTPEQYENKLHPVDTHKKYHPVETNFEATVKYLSPVLPRLNLSLAEYALQQHLSLNLSRAGYRHLFSDRYTFSHDPIWGDTIRGFADPSYVLSRRAKLFYAGTAHHTDSYPEEMHLKSPLHYTIAPRPQNCDLDVACALCNIPFYTNSQVILLPCTHLLHTSCASEWFVNIADWCPVCEYPYRHLCHTVHACIIDDWSWK
ncbi:uncharacterized protein SAPINGB_P005501 [Magnusiomyces paraingens]|uniref:RING-type domain-containing protein n=1 Tax=Magnusiomyces paraingens TaxID=2606893 RepID=A0A5E8C007_9ASCO|nr:uncharacterized protein SAPINGB_P005501 [Saprochaete ingens]VVT57034.1 unnamed protein product [Saprochaete ingens]